MIAPGYNGLVEPMAFEMTAIPVNQVDEICRGPDRIAEMCRIGYDQLLQVYDISDEEQVDDKKITIAMSVGRFDKSSGYRAI